MVVDDMVVQDKPSVMRKLASVFRREEEFEDEIVPAPRPGEPPARTNYRYTVTVRRQITSFEDALAAAHGLKRGEQQILNLTGTDMATRQKIVDFMCGVNFAQEGTWEEVGEDIYLLVPGHAYVEVAPPSSRISGYAR